MNASRSNCTHAEEAKAGGVHPALLLLPHLAIQFVSWLQIVLSLNRFNGVARFTRAELAGLAIYLCSAFVRWTASLATTNASFAFQAVTACIGGLMSFSGFIIIYNDRVALPTRQQRNSILLVLVITTLWETVSRMMMIVDTSRPDD